jgi:hypothetical protein
LLKLYLTDTYPRGISISGTESRGKLVPLVSAFLLSVAVQVFFTIPLAYWLGGAVSRAGIKKMERQTARIKRLRIKRKIRGRDDDDFKVA